MSAEEEMKYIFPDFLSKIMSKIDTRTQFESSMLSMTLIMIGMIISVVYFVVYFDFALWYRIVLVINGIAGVIFLSSFLITTFQSYTSHLEVLEFQKEQ